MKKLMLFSAILVGAASASQAGGIHFGFGFPLPTPRAVIISRPAAFVPAPIVAAPSDCYTPQVVVTPPVCETAPVCEPGVVVRDGYYPNRYVYRDRRPFLCAQKWDRHER